MKLGNANGIESDSYGRKDALRNFEQRRDTYVSFYETLRKTAGEVKASVAAQRP